MKIFLDTANLEEIKKWADRGVIDGVTTNPTLLSKEKGDYKDLLIKICEVVKGDVSIEVVEKDPEMVFKQALEISRISSNVVVKIPFSEKYLKVISSLVKEGVRINATLIFSLLQALLMAKLNVLYISPFLGRWDDIDVDGLKLLEQLVVLKTKYNFQSKILAASIRNLMHWHYATLLGVDVITLPPRLLDQVMSHPLTTQGIEKFEIDWEKSQKKLV